jgi:uncharacterized protein
MANVEGGRSHGRSAVPPRTAIGLIAKAPTPGRVKTRLCPPLTPAEAAEVAAALLADTAANAAATGHDLWAVHTGEEDGIAALLPPDTPLLAQRGEGLAERLAAAQADLHRVGYLRVVLLGGDCPTVTPCYLMEAIALLDVHDVVLGAAADGGYTLIGSSGVAPALFAVEMSTPRVLADTLDRAAAGGLRFARLPARHDLDDAEDLLDAAATGQLASAPRTSALVERFRDRLTEHMRGITGA